MIRLDDLVIGTRASAEQFRIGNEPQKRIVLPRLQWNVVFDKPLKRIQIRDIAFSFANDDDLLFHRRTSYSAAFGTPA